MTDLGKALYGATAPVTPAQRTAIPSDFAKALYGSAASKPTPAVTTPGAAKDHATTLYGSNATTAPEPAAQDLGETHNPAVTPAPASAPAAKPSPDAANTLSAGTYHFTVPAGLEHLGLVPDEEAGKEFTQLARGIGLNNDQAQQLLELHLRRIYSGKGGK